MHIMMPRGADHELDEAHTEPPIKVMPARAFGFVAYPTDSVAFHA
jgi:hypothetical protein